MRGFVGMHVGGGKKICYGMRKRYRNMRVLETR